MFTLNWIELASGLQERLTYKGIEIPILREQISSRGGGIEIDISPLGFHGEKMTAYQNYLGGGMLGAVQSDCTFLHNTFIDDDAAKEIETIQEDLKRFLHELTTLGMSFEDNQRLPASAY